MNKQTIKPPAFYNQAQPTGEAKKPGKNNKLRSILTVVGLTLFFVAAMLGVMIAQRQRVAQGPVAPNAPASKPAASSGESCDLTRTVRVVAVPDDSCQYSDWSTDGDCGSEDNICEEGQRYQVRTIDNDVVDTEICTESLEQCIVDTSCVGDDPETTTAPTPTDITYQSCNQNPPECVISNLTALTATEDTATDPKHEVTASWEVTGSLDNEYRITYSSRVKGSTQFGDWTALPNFPATTLSTAKYTVDEPLDPNLEYELWVRCERTDIDKDANNDNQYCHNQMVEFSAVDISPTPTSTIDPDNPVDTPTPTPTYACDSSCDTDANCQTVNAEYICSSEYGDKCRLDSNRVSDVCEAKEDTFACDSPCDNTDECKTANSNYKCSTTYGDVCRLASNEGASNCLPVNYVAAPTLSGCNDTCDSNSNCMYSNYICYTANSSNNVCRLDQYPNSDTCRPPAVVNAYVPPARQVYIPTEQVVYVQQNPTTYSPEIPVFIPTPAPRADYTPLAQPDLPAALPQTGPADWANWLKAGLVTLGLGAALLLLL
jgi:hypothetical protein